MHGQMITLKNVGISVGIFAGFYLIYTQHVIMVQVQSRGTETNEKQVGVLGVEQKLHGVVTNVLRSSSEAGRAIITRIGRKCYSRTWTPCRYILWSSEIMLLLTPTKASIETPEHAEDTVLTEVAKVPDFADDQLNVRTLPTDQYMLYELFWKYTMVNTFQFVCSHQVRFGPGRDTGYDVCLDEAYRPGQPCIVYSFGSLFMFGFEEYAIKHHQCEVHTYDPSHPIANHVIPQGVNFHLVGLGDTVTTNSKGWKMQTFSDIRRTLNHTQKTIDILKIDIEGGEWVSLAHALRSGELRFVKQLQIELHLWGQHRVGMSLVGKLTVLKQLYEQGFRIFYHEPWPTVDCNRLMRPPHPKITLCVILSLVNTKYQPN